MYFIILQLTLIVYTTKNIPSQDNFIFYNTDIPFEKLFCKIKKGEGEEKAIAQQTRSSSISRQARTE